MRNRILEAGGGALQLSIYADDPNSTAIRCYVEGANACTTESQPLDAKSTCNAYKTVTETWIARAVGAAVADCKTVFPCNGADTGFPWNPVQTQSAMIAADGSQQCAYDPSSTSNDNVKLSASLAVSGNPPTSTSLTIARQNPYQFSKNIAFAGLTWTQTTTVIPGAPYVKITYTIDWAASATSTNGLNGVSSGTSEMPALFLKPTFTRGQLYFAKTTGYANGPVNCDGTSGCSSGQQLIYFDQSCAGKNPPSACVTQPTGPSPEKFFYSTEGWTSTCDASTPPACITVASFEPYIAIQWTPSTGSASAGYLGIYAQFNLGTLYNNSFTLYVFPYRYDDVVGGITIRQWIYNLHAS